MYLGIRAIWLLWLWKKRDLIDYLGFDYKDLSEQFENFKRERLGDEYKRIKTDVTALALLLSLSEDLQEKMIVVANWLEMAGSLKKYEQKQTKRYRKRTASYA